MGEYIYVLPYKIIGSKNLSNNEEIVTQRSSFVMEKNLVLDVLKDILTFANNKKLSEIKKAFSNRLNSDKFDEIINFLVERNLIYISDKKLSKENINFIEFLSQYTKSLKKYTEKMNERIFYIYKEGENISALVGKVKGFGLNCKVISEENIDELAKGDIILSSVSSFDIEILDKIGEKIEDKKDSLFAFLINYEDSFILSPLLNKRNFIDYNSFKCQLNLESLKNKGLSKNKLVQDMGVSQLLLEVLTSMMKLNIETNYDKSIMVNSITKKMDVTKVYYYPDSSIFKSKNISLKRWDDEVD